MLLDGQNVGTAEEFSQQASDLAEAGADATVSDSDKWMPLGVFAMVRNDKQHPQLILQLAINKQGVLRGNYTDEVTDHTLPIRGAVDQQTQRAAWIVGDNRNSVMEAGVNNLTQGETRALLHKNGKTERWLLVSPEPARAGAKLRAERGSSRSAALDVTADTNVYVSALVFAGAPRQLLLDLDDNRVVESAVTTGSHFIVTGDGDLLRLGSYGSIQIVKVGGFLEHHWRNSTLTLVSTRSGSPFAQGLGDPRMFLAVFVGPLTAVEICPKPAPYPPRIAQPRPCYADGPTAAGRQRSAPAAPPRTVRGPRSAGHHRHRLGRRRCRCWCQRG